MRVDRKSASVIYKVLPANSSPLIGVLVVTDIFVFPVTESVRKEIIVPEISISSTPPLMPAPIIVPSGLSFPTIVFTS